MCPDISSQLENIKLTSGTSSDGLPVSALAFLGDGVWGLLTREYLTVSGMCKADKLHERNTQMVNATYQCAASKVLFPLLNEDEQTMFIRGRNTHTAHTPRNKSKSEYHAATGLEVLFGWLYINGRTDRIKELFAVAVSEVCL
ncbi:MAG: ribonuclease III [Clostridia bacterium]|nr:ribonuclease III [Clostridia bacterium]